MPIRRLKGVPEGVMQNNFGRPVARSHRLHHLVRACWHAAGFEEVAIPVPNLVAVVLELANKDGIDGAQISAIVELQCQLLLQQHIVARTRCCQLRKWRERCLGENGHKDV